MKFLLALIAGLFVTEAVSAGLNFDASGCFAEKSSLGCLCQGGSGNYTWRFTDLPEGWQALGDRIYPKNGQWDEKKLYGAKVQLYDNITKQALRKSLFFSFNNGQFRAVDDDYNFDPNSFLSQLKNTLARSEASYNEIYNQKRQELEEQQNRWQNVRNIFNDVDTIGGGIGLDRLSPFFQGRGQFTYDQSNNSNNVSNQGFVSTQVVQTNYRQQGTVSNTARATVVVDNTPTNPPKATQTNYRQQGTVPNTAPSTSYIDPVKTVVADNTPTYPTRVAQTFPPKVSTQTYPAKEQVYVYNQFIPSKDLSSTSSASSTSTASSTSSTSTASTTSSTSTASTASKASSVAVNVGLKFDGFDFQRENFFDDYIEKVYGSAFRVFKSSLRTNRNSRIRVNKCNIFNQDWVKAFGNPWDKYTSRFDADWQEARKKFDAEDFKCNERDFKVKSYGGKIKQIRGNVIRVSNSKNEQCDVILGSCSNVEIADGSLPQVGQTIFWRGTRKENKQNAQVQAHHVTCFEK